MVACCLQARTLTNFEGTLHDLQRQRQWQRDGVQFRRIVADVFGAVGARAVGAARDSAVGGQPSLRDAARVAAFRGAWRLCCADHELQPVARSLRTAEQLFESLQVWHGVMLVGKSLTGKTTAWSMVARSMTTLAAKEASEREGVAV